LEIHRLNGSALRARSVAIAKALIAVLAMAGLAVVVARHLAPNVSLGAVLLYSAISAASLLAFIFVAAFVGMRLNHYLLSKGRDPGWFWEPPGLVDLRRKKSDSDPKTPGSGH
jgi:hypothetical protein